MHISADTQWTHDRISSTSAFHGTGCEQHIMIGERLMHGVQTMYDDPQSDMLTADLALVEEDAAEGEHLAVLAVRVLELRQVLVQVAAELGVHGREGRLHQRLVEDLQHGTRASELHQHRLTIAIILQ